MHSYPFIKGVCLMMLLSALVFTGCKKSPEGELQADAIVHDSGNPAADGCDWSVQIGNTYYHADNLTYSNESNDAYKINNQKVHITYSIVGGNYSCGWLAGGKFPILHISSIHKIN